MNRKALLFGALALLVMFAVLPAANAVVLDPMWCPAGNSTAVKNIYAQYNSSKKTCTYGLISDLLIKKYNVGRNVSKLDNILKNKPVSNLTWNEAYYLANLYSISPGVFLPYTTAMYQKDLQYAKRMIQVRNTSQSRALAYYTLSGAAESMVGMNNYKPKYYYPWVQKELYYRVMFLQNNPDGVINDGGTFWNTSDIWTDPAALIVNDLQPAGYKVPQKAIDFLDKAWEAARAGKLNTPEDLKKIGFYQWKKNYLIPIVNQKMPERLIIANHIPGLRNNPYLTNIVFKYKYYIFGAIAVIVGLFVGLIGLFLKRRNRY